MWRSCLLWWLHCCWSSQMVSGLQSLHIFVVCLQLHSSPHAYIHYRICPVDQSRPLDLLPQGIHEFLPLYICMPPILPMARVPLSPSLFQWLPAAMLPVRGFGYLYTNFRSSPISAPALANFISWWTTKSQFPRTPVKWSLICGSVFK